MKRLVALLALAVALVGCGGAGYTSNGLITTWHDDANGVTCWMSSSGIACLPDKDLHGSPTP